MGSNLLRLVLFFTYGVSLRAWNQSGSFDREVALYRRLQDRGVDVSFVTYGDSGDLAYADRIPGIHILCNQWGLPHRLYKRLIPLLHTGHLARCDVVKTNQINGADAALRAARFWRKPLIARCGYLWSEWLIHQHGMGADRTQRILDLENSVFAAARSVVVTTQMMAEDIANRVLDAANRVCVIPNYVETDLFCPAPHPQGPEFDLVFVGRLTPQKNLHALLEALQSLEASLLLIGSGELEESLKQQFGNLDGRITWKKNVPNAELPHDLNRARIFILPSHWEGHPKTLIEAMACGLPVIGTNVQGIREVIDHRQTGFLCGTSSDEIRAALLEVLSNEELRGHMGRMARQFAVEQFSIDRVLELEMETLSVVYKRQRQDE